MTLTCYIIRSGTNPKMILTTTGEFKPESMVGPGGYSARVYRTWSGAQLAADNRGGLVKTLREKRKT